MSSSLTTTRRTKLVATISISYRCLRIASALRWVTSRARASRPR